MRKDRVWFITGCSTGLGHELAHQILDQGGSAVLTAGNPAQLKGEVAGYGYFAAIEEGEDLEIRRQFETNVFGLFSLTRHACFPA